MVISTSNSLLTLWFLLGSLKELLWTANTANKTLPIVKSYATNYPEVKFVFVVHHEVGVHVGKHDRSVCIVYVRRD
ncbi:hypothetical protein Nepgr_002442 [Nepenthes gracilis]|uniref:Secreted protein n=1 Tax=Nepenthes gracilis TaxID=150966 RepID=A0AAD3RY88_NEPGR|nr:hypothetical protein Nepgr_002442 [Nepenthes gracilis]